MYVSMRSQLVIFQYLKDLRIIFIFALFGSFLVLCAYLEYYNEYSYFLSSIFLSKFSLVDKQPLLLKNLGTVATTYFFFSFFLVLFFFLFLFFCLFLLNFINGFYTIELFACCKYFFSCLFSFHIAWFYLFPLSVEVHMFLIKYFTSNYLTGYVVYDLDITYILNFFIYFWFYFILFFIYVICFFCIVKGKSLERIRIYFFVSVCCFLILCMPPDFFLHIGVIITSASLLESYILLNKAYNKFLFVI